MEILGNLPDRADKMTVCLGSVLGVMFWVSAFLQRFKAHRSDLWHEPIWIYIFFSFGKRVLRINFDAHISFNIWTGPLFGQIFSIRLDVTPRGCKGDQVNTLYTLLFFILNEINCLALLIFFSSNTIWFKYDCDWFVCKEAALRSIWATLREWIHNINPPSCSG